jgi:hypothetical protein
VASDQTMKGPAEELNRLRAEQDHATDLAIYVGIQRASSGVRRTTNPHLPISSTKLRVWRVAANCSDPTCTRWLGSPIRACIHQHTEWRLDNSALRVNSCRGHFGAGAGACPRNPISAYRCPTTISSRSCDFFNVRCYKEAKP